MNTNTSLLPAASHPASPASENPPTLSELWLPDIPLEPGERYVGQFAMDREYRRIALIGNPWGPKDE